MTEIGKIEGLSDWVIQVFIVVFVTLLIALIQHLLFNHLQRQLQKTANLWDDTLVYALRRPLTALIWVIGITFAAELARQATQAVIFDAISPIRDVLVIAVIAWTLLRFITQAQENLVAARKARGKEVDHTTVDAIGKLLRVSVLITTTLVVLQTLGYSISGVLAFGGIGGIAIGFAAKDLLANFFGGLMIYLDRPFTIGEWIRSPDREIEGTVEHIGWRLTRIRTFDKRLLFVPNMVFANVTVETPSRMSHRRIYETIGLRYEDADKMEAITSAIRTMLQTHPEIDTSQTLMVNFNSFAPSSLDFFIYTFTRTTVWTRFHEIKHEILLSIHKIIAEHGAEEAFPTSTVHLANPVITKQAIEG